MIGRPRWLLLHTLLLALVLPRLAPAQDGGQPRVLLRTDAGVRAFDSSNVRITRMPGRLQGTMLRPRGVSRPPVALIVGGSAPVDRQGNVPGTPARHDALRQLAESLAVNGIASVRYDKRGVAGSASARIPEVELRYQVLAYDVVAWLDFIARQGTFGPVFVIGHDDGALLATVTERDRPVAGYILLVAPGRNIADAMRDGLTAQHVGIPSEVDSVIAQLRSGRPVEQMSLSTANLFPPAMHGYLASMMRYSPAAAVASLDTPCLILHGRHDAQVPLAHADSLARAQPACLRAVIDSMTHTLKRGPADPEGQAPMYLDPTLPLAPGLVGRIVDFVHLLVDKAPERCTTDSAVAQPRVLIGQPLVIPQRESPVFLDGRYLGPLDTATIATALVDSLASKQLLIGREAARFGPTAQKCGALVMRTAAAYAADTAEALAAVWQAEVRTHRPPRVVLVTLADSGRYGRAISSRLRLAVEQRGIATTDRSVAGDDTVLVAVDVLELPKNVPSETVEAVVRARWTERSVREGAPCRLSASSTSLYALQFLSGSWMIAPLAPPSATQSECLPITPPPR
jgi:uncharacterized protein